MANIADATTVIIRQASDRAERLSARAAAVQWRAVFGPMLRRLPLLLLMLAPFVIGFAARMVVRILLRSVWALGWTAAWLWYTAAEGWNAAAGDRR